MTAAFILSMLYYSFSNNPITIFSLVIGNSRIHNPVALNTAWANAGDGVLITISPIDFAPNGPVAHNCSQILHEAFQHRLLLELYTA